MLVDGHWIYLSEELPPALLRAGVPWLAAVALRQYVNLGRQADQDPELKRRERVAELERRSTAERLDLAQSLHDDLGHSLSPVALTFARAAVSRPIRRSPGERSREPANRCTSRSNSSRNGGGGHPQRPRRRGTP